MTMKQAIQEILADYNISLSEARIFDMGKIVEYPPFVCDEESEETK